MCKAGEMTCVLVKLCMNSVFMKISTYIVMVYIIIPFNLVNCINFPCQMLYSSQESTVLFFAEGRRCFGLYQTLF